MDSGKIYFPEENEFHTKSRRLLGATTTPTMVSLLLRSGIAKSERQAAIILVSIVIACLGLASLLFFFQGKVNTNVVMDREGNQYTIDQYMELVRQGRDPLLHK